MPLSVYSDSDRLRETGETSRQSDIFMFGLTRERIGDAFRDLYQGLLGYRLWHLLAWQDIKQRYRRSTLGPFWFTLSMAVTIAVMGTVITFLFRFPVEKYLPYVAAGIVLWNTITAIISDGAMTFVQSAQYITQIKRPITTYIYQTVWRNVIILGHSLVVFFVVWLIFGIEAIATLPLILISLPLSLVSVAWIALLLAILSARYRDIPIMVQSLFAVLFWLSPIVYYPDQLGPRRIIVDLNPLTHIIGIVRDPLLGQVPSLTSWLVVIGFSIVGWTVTFLFFARFRARIVYWL